jgi:RHS repeat-associated protein
MAMKKRFYTMNSQMMAYDEGGVTKDFLTDHLGSITAEINQAQTRTYDTRYSAYGRNNWSTGTGCGFGWVGSYGYRETGLFHMSHYVRARHYSYLTGGWSTVDPLWPRESAYGYVSGRTSSKRDPSGLKVTVDPNCGQSNQAAMNTCCTDFYKKVFSGGKVSSDIIGSIQSCLKDKGFSGDKGISDSKLTDFLNRLKSYCTDGSKNSVMLTCPPAELPKGCNPCPSGAGASTISPAPFTNDNPGVVLPGCNWKPGPTTGPCAPLISPAHSCTVVMCTRHSSSDACTMLFHELTHCMGNAGLPGHNNHDLPHKDVIYAINCCLCEAVSGKGSPSCYNCKGFK